MGNSESKDQLPPKSPASASADRERRPGTIRNQEGKHLSHGARRNLPTATVSTSTTNAHASITASPSNSIKSYTRARSITTGTPTRIAAQELALSHNSDPSAMGNSDSKPQHRPPSRSNTLPPHTTPPAKRTEPKETSSTSPQHAEPVDVPPPAQDGSVDKHDDYTQTGYAESPYNLGPANFSRPPRLPLPIEEEVHAPGSPIILPQDLEDVSKLENIDVDEGRIPRKTSVLSSTTIDDDDVGDNDAFAAESTHWGDVRVPTMLEWNGQGDKVFVTGTFCNWEKKMKLHRDKGKKNFSAIVQLPPGTHHVKFLVDGEMVTSPQLPTTVDWTNILVNYIEIVAPVRSVKIDQTQQPPAPAVPMAIPGAALTADQATATDEGTARPDPHVPGTEADIPSTLQEAEGKGVQVGSMPKPIPGSTAIPATPRDEIQEPQPTPAPPKQKLPRPQYNNQIPEFLIDLDNYTNPEDERFQRAQKVANTLPQPPSLPMFLSKSILNGATPHKDDASVLIMPNHTVLNHLATSSIKSGVLATSGTTRYKRKFLTTIMYKPTSDDG
ncbi:carbohydrate-binding module family 48 protein [Dothistroma septosporum NZE10]|uniref:Carbohydrate-binding module family 48 protein n=1 Tax=Dothistroma septosporum (strain NZE10 / CBS 128990) TaxID=675120 RepID=M2YNR9_DOTSN|nr:carbohydrate-binding module family 48 protein [Dothistroma septosporum NZE10]